jgi:hypothetical protein
LVFHRPSPQWAFFRCSTVSVHQVFFDGRKPNKTGGRLWNDQFCTFHHLIWSCYEGANISTKGKEVFLLYHRCNESREQVRS